jgi:hypothetical protein
MPIIRNRTDSPQISGLLCQGPYELRRYSPSATGPTQRNGRVNVYTLDKTLSIAFSTARESNNRGSVVDSASMQATPNFCSSIKGIFMLVTDVLNSVAYSDFLHIDVDGRGFQIH